MPVKLVKQNGDDNYADITAKDLLSEVESIREGLVNTFIHHNDVSLPDVRAKIQMLCRILEIPDIIRKNRESAK